MAILTFINALLDKRKGVREYSDMLGRFLGEGVLSEDEKQQLAALQGKYNLTDSDLVSVRRAAHPVRLGKSLLTNASQKMSENHLRRS